MNPIYILRYIRGYVEFEAQGGFCERFINLCAVNRIPIWNVEIKKSNIKASVLITNFIKLRNVSKKSGCRIKISNKCGLPFFMRQNKNRIGLLFSAIFMIVFFTVMNQFIWITEVTGTDTVSHEEIKNYVAESGLKVGSFAPSVDTVNISRNAVNHFNGRLMWMAINIKGSKAVIEVRDYIDEHEDKQFRDPCNIIADFEGKIISVEVINGDKETDEGSAVKKGDLLISGVLENRDMSTSYCEARGRITALHTINKYSSFPLKNESERQISRIRTRYSIYLFGLKIPLGYIKNGSFDFSYEYVSYLNVDSNLLPFGIIKTVFCNVDEASGNNSQLLFCLDSFTDKFYNEYKNTNILRNEMNIIKNQDSYTVKENLECIDFIGKPSPIYAEFYEN
ncbi:MAG: sporulation protein YqfD [Acutalibacteraceae bacterium]|nr:sporulation protein YqfD [Acutalibacteraceae bacterium]